MKLVFVLALTWATADVSSAADAERIRSVLIGVPAALATAHGQGTHDAVQLGIDDANKQQLRIKGERIQFKAFLADDKNDPNLAVLVARSMVASGVTAVIGHRTTDTSVAVAKIYNEAGIPMIAPAAAGRALTQMRYRNVFQAIGSSEVTVEYIADALTGPVQAKRLMLIDSDNILGREMVENLMKTLTRRGLPPVDRQSISTRSSDFTNIISRIRTVNPDVVFYTGFPPQSTAFSERLKQSGINVKLFITGGGINPEFPRSAGHYADGVWMLGYGMPLDKTPGIKPLEAAYKARFNSQFVQQTLFAYDAVGVLAAAIKQADSLDGSEISEALHKIKYKGVSRPISFDVNGSLAAPIYTLYEVQAGAWKVVRRYP